MKVSAKVGAIDRKSPSLATDTACQNMSDAAKNRPPITEVTRQKQSEAAVARLANRVDPYRDTKPERSFEAQLQVAGYKYEKQKRIGSMLVDFYLPQQNLVVEIDGCWWHGCLDCHPDGGANLDRFESRKSRLKVLGYSAIRIWEHELIGMELKK